MSATARATVATINDTNDSTTTKRTPKVDVRMSHGQRRDWTRLRDRIARQDAQNAIRAAYVEHTFYGKGR